MLKLKVIHRTLLNAINNQSKYSVAQISTSSSQKSNEKDKDKVKDLLDEAAIGINETSPEHDNWSTSPYPEGTVFSKNRDQSKKSKRPRKDPRDCSIILFPGQGAQYVGMAKDLIKIPEARDIYQLANEILGYDLLKICLEGPKEKLDKTVYCQPAVMVTSLASLEKLKEERPMAIENCTATAGFSLGELTALVFSGAIPFDRGLKLVQIRAEAMQRASEENPGGMMTVMYGPDSKLGDACIKATEWCLEKGVENPDCRIANFLYPHCKVIAGSLEALKFIESNYKNYKLKRVKRLPVSGAFHTSLMESAVEPFRQGLKKIPIEKPIVSVHSNVDGKRYRDASHILNQLPKQIVKPVKWEQTLHILYERSQGEAFPRTFETAPGRSLITILKQVNAKAWDSSIAVDEFKNERKSQEQL
jgi:[acyl-carrier-protein] S-malonyltransferase